MAILVHTISGAPRGWRVLAGLALKNLEWENRFLNFGEKEHLQPEFLAINPRGTVPVLEDDGIVINDSLGILAWLDRKYPEHPLFGTSVEEAAQIWQQTTDINDYMRAACDALLSKIFPNDDVVPSPESDLWQAMQNGAELMHTECARHEDALKNFAYLAGENQSAADAVALPEFSLLKRAIDTKPVLMEAWDLKTWLPNIPIFGHGYRVCRPCQKFNKTCHPTGIYNRTRELRTQNDIDQYRHQRRMACRSTRAFEKRKSPYAHEGRNFRSAP